jgi:hypothetical protein
MDTSKRALLIICLGLCLLSPTLAVGYDPSTIVTTDKYFTMNGSSAFIVYPTGATAHTPWVWYAPTVNTTNPWYPDATTDWLFQRLLNAGIAIAGVNVGESYGSPAGQAIYTQFYNYATQHSLGAKPLLLGQSRGGLMMYNWAEDTPGNAQKISAMVGIYPVGDLTSYPGLATAAPAYGMTLSQFQAVYTQYNPIDNLTPLYQAGVPIFHIAGDSDTIVPLSKNSQVIYNRYTAMGGTMTLKVIAGYGHAEIPQYFQDTDLLNFMLNHTSTPGDANRDGSVNGADLNIVLSYYTQPGQNWNHGDFDGNGMVNGADLNVVLSNYNQGAGLAAGGESVPEPCTLALFGAAVVGLVACAWRKQT